MSLNLFFVLLAVAIVASAVAMLVMARQATPVRGLGLLLVAAVLLPVEVGDGNINASLILTALLCGTWLLHQAFVQRRVAFDRSRVVVAAVVFMAVAVLSFVVGQYPWFPLAPAPMRAQVGGLAVFVLSGGLFLFVGHQVRSLRQLQALTWLFIAAGAVQVGMMVVAKDLSLASLAVTNVRSVGSLFWVWLVAVSFSQALVNDDVSPVTRIAAFAVGVFALVWATLLAASWVSGWLPSLVALAVVFLVRFPKLAVGTGLLLAAPAMAVAGRAADAVLTAESYSWDTRLEAWRVMFRLISNNPVLGFGPANYHFYTPLFPFLGYPAMFNSHNNYIDLLAQTGVVGLAAFCWLAVELFRLAWRLLARSRGGFARAYVAGALGGAVASLLAGLLADWIIPFTYNIGLKGFRSSLLFWFFLGGLLALKRIWYSQGAQTEVWAAPHASVLFPERQL